jgi:hypothetical protein
MAVEGSYAMPTSKQVLTLKVKVAELLRRYGRSEESLHKFCDLGLMD